MKLQHIAMLFVMAFTISAHADFFAFRKFIHPHTKKVVYLLYDVHASAIKDPSLQEALDAQMTDIIESGLKKQKELQKKGYVNLNQEEWRGITNEDIFSRMRAQEPFFRNNMPNLVKQHNDLIKIVKNYHVSLINEDWDDLTQEERFFPIGHVIKLYTHATRIVGYTQSHKNNLYQVHVSPMRHIGKSLVGELRPLTFYPFGKAYFFNPDARTGNYHNQADDLAVDNATLSAIEALFSKYHQNAVIVSLGYCHGVHIAERLLQQGYTASDLMISNDLKALRKSCMLVDKELKILEDSDFTQINTPTGMTCEEYDKLAYSLAACPLDIDQIFTAELSSPAQTNYVYAILQAAYHRLCSLL